MSLSSVSIIGSGNLATHLAKALFQNQILIKQICSKNIAHAKDLAKQVEAHAVSDINFLVPVDLIIICVSDSAIAEVSNSLKNTKSLVVHTSGSTSIEVLKAHSDYGVFYPFQTFSKNVELKFCNIPVFIEANNSENASLLKELASCISSEVKDLNSDQRLKLHLAAVFACSFSNHMYAISRDILAEAGISFDIIKHLIEETTSKALNSGNPAEVQTGPAVRVNIDILEKHKEILNRRPLWQKIYTFVSDSIMERVSDKSNGTL